jgi:membrane-associated phospholipid phosphatase
MPRLTEKPRRRRPGVEPLEARGLLSITLHLSEASSPGGDFVDVTSSRLVLVGQAPPGSTVSLGRSTGPDPARTIARTTANARGAYRFQVDDGMGTAVFTATAAEPSGVREKATLSVTRANQVVAWNSVALQAIRTGDVQAPDAARDLAIVEVSVYDAVNRADPRGASYGIPLKPARGASPDAAAATAAETALVALFPDQASTLSAQRKASLASIPGGSSKARGIALGRSVAAQILALRSHDGSGATVAYDPAPGPGVWVPTPTAFAGPVDPQWGGVTPFALASGSQFQPPPPPAITSPRYAAEYNQVKVLGVVDSPVRTADQTALAHFWSDLTGTFDPPGHWNQIGEIAAVARRTGLAASARMFALLDMALADAGIEAWGVKYTDNTWRPVTAIRAGDDGLNPLVQGDPTWTPLWSTPPFPSYISGHSTFSAAAAAVLDSVFGKKYSFDDPGDPSLALPSRHFASFDQAAREAGVSRIFGGIHFMSDNTAGLQVGGEVGRYVVRHELKPLKAGRK